MSCSFLGQLDTKKWWRYSREAWASFLAACELLKFLLSTRMFLSPPHLSTKDSQELLPGRTFCKYFFSPLLSHLTFPTLGVSSSDLCLPRRQVRQFFRTQASLHPISGLLWFSVRLLHPQSCISQQGCRDAGTFLWLLLADGHRPCWEVPRPQSSGDPSRAASHLALGSSGERQAAQKEELDDLSGCLSPSGDSRRAQTPGTRGTWQGERPGTPESARCVNVWKQRLSQGTFSNCKGNEASSL